jgi:membrane peptidoglycan carboxypeptidase
LDLFPSDTSVHFSAGKTGTSDETDAESLEEHDNTYAMFTSQDSHNTWAFKEKDSVPAPPSGMFVPRRRSETDFSVTGLMVENFRDRIKDAKTAMKDPLEDFSKLMSRKSPNMNTSAPSISMDTTDYSTKGDFSTRWDKMGEEMTTSRRTGEESREMTQEEEETDNTGRLATGITMEKEDQNRPSSSSSKRKRSKRAKGGGRRKAPWP